MERLKHCIPESSWLLITAVLKNYPGELIISKPRKSKLGDFKANSRTGKISISVNSDLNQYSFLITLVHELAHYFIWEKHKSAVLPHGIEWKSQFKELLTPFIQIGVFPMKLESELKRHFKSPKASSCTDEALFKVLDLYNTPDGLKFISNLPLGTNFSFQDRGLFRIKEHLRKLIKCEHHQTGKIYLFQPITKVRLVDQ